MADEAFALSPISARSASPTDADYDAISEAFMETARGRWFLGEFAKRNRNADTAMVLDAVARIERTIAAQKTPPADELNAALAAIRDIVANTKTAVAEALGDPVLDHILAPHRKSARVIREIAWGLRESGADVRICDLLDGQVQAINAACDSFAAFPMREAALQAVDTAMAEIGRIAAGDIPASTAEAPADGDLAAPDEQTDVALELTGSTLPEPEAPPQDEPTGEIEPDLTMAAVEAPETSGTLATPAEIEPEALETFATPTDIAPEPIEALTIETAPEAPDAARDAAEGVIAPEAIEQEAELADALAHEIFAEPATPEPSRHHHTVLAQIELMPITEPGPAAELPGPADESLGASLIASGIVPKPAAPKADPLAPIRRMSQAEKIAFFS